MTCASVLENGVFFPIGRLSVSDVNFVLKQMSVWNFGEKDAKAVASLWGGKENYGSQNKG